MKELNEPLPSPDRKNDTERLKVKNLAANKQADVPS